MIHILKNQEFPESNYHSYQGRRRRWASIRTPRLSKIREIEICHRRRRSHRRCCHWTSPTWSRRPIACFTVAPIGSTWTSWYLSLSPSLLTHSNTHASWFFYVFPRNRNCAAIAISDSDLGRFHWTISNRFSHLRSFDKRKGKKKVELDHLQSFIFASILRKKSVKSLSFHDAF